MPRKNGEQYLALRRQYKDSLLRLIGEATQKKLASDGEVAQSTVSSWATREMSIPDIVVGAMIAKKNGRTVEEMIYGERPIYRHRSKEIREIVELLESVADDKELVIEIRGLVRRHVADSGRVTRSDALMADIEDRPGPGLSPLKLTKTQGDADTKQNSQL